MLDEHHPTISALRSLIPEGTVIGCSFAPLLPDPKSLASENRRREFQKAKEAGLNFCIEKIWKITGAAVEPVSGKDEHGRRYWPENYTGSLTHKGTVILAALAKKGILPTIGIDLELIVEPEQESVQMGLDSKSLVNRGHHIYGNTLSLSMKEAVFKAQSPITNKILDFDDIKLHPRGRFHAVTYFENGPVFSVKSLIVEKWLISAAKLEK